MSKYGVAGLLLLLVAACGGGGTDSQAEVEEAVAGYSEAFLSGEGGAAYGMLSDRCRTQVPEGEFLAAVAIAGDQYGDQEVVIDEVSVDGESASVSYRFPDAPQLDQDGERWVFEGDRWRNDDC